MWYGGTYRTSNPKPKGHCSLGEFAVHIFKSRDCPSHINPERWEGMIKWMDTRTSEGFTLREIIAMDEDWE